MTSLAAQLWEEQRWGAGQESRADKIWYRWRKKRVLHIYLHRCLENVPNGLIPAWKMPHL